MKCLKCNRIFDPSDEEVAHAKEVGSILGYPDCIETCLPHYCSWDCFKLATHFKSHGKKGRMKKYKEKNRWAYHIGEVPPMSGTQEAKTEEERYRKNMEQSCRRKPPKIGHSGFSEGTMSNTPILPKAGRRRHELR